VSFRVLGIDPGTAVTGYGVVEPADGRPGRLVECGVIRTDPKQQMWSRLDTLYQGVCELIARHGPDAIAVESVFYGKNARSALALGQARGVILLAAARAEIAIAEFPPATVKQSVTGRGGAAKAQVGYMVQQLLRLTRPPAPSDAADGVAVALTYILTQPSRTRRRDRQKGQNGQQGQQGPSNHRGRR
jgi:crossover junction endodeoxyribonuclease RuvC